MSTGVRPKIIKALLFNFDILLNVNMNISTFVRTVLRLIDLFLCHLDNSDQ